MMLLQIPANILSFRVVKRAPLIDKILVKSSVTFIERKI